MAEPRAAARPLRVGYLVKMYPRFSETFIVNEILELERQGVEVRIFSLIQPDEGRFHGALADVQAPVTYLPAPRHSDSWDMLQKEMATRDGRWPGLQRAFAHGIRCGVSSSLKYLLQACHLMPCLGDIDHLHAHFASSPAHVAMYASMLSGVPYSFTAHAKDIYHDDYQGQLLADKMRHAAFVVTVAESNRQHLLETYGSWLEPTVVRLYNGIDLDLFPMREEVRDPDLVVAVGRLVEKKGFAHLVEAARLLVARGRRLRVVIVGDGEQRAALEAQIEAAGLAAVVTLAGPLSQQRVRELLARATVMALPCIIAKDGNRDALPTVLLEAMAARLPIVSTPIVGIPEILDGGNAGLITPEGDTAELAGALERLLGDPELRRTLAARGRARAEALFDVHASGRSLRSLFERSATSGAAPAAADELAS